MKPFLKYVLYFTFSYRLRIEALLMKEEFTHHMDWIRPSINAIILTAQGRNIFCMFDSQKERHCLEQSQRRNC